MFQDLESTARNFGSWRLPRPARLLGWVLELDARHRQRTALERLDDRLLRDIGVTRTAFASDPDRPIPNHGPF